MTDQTDALQAHIQQAIETNTPLRIIGGGSKDFLAETLQGEPFDVSGHNGIINYDPRELVLTARAGTPLLELETLLAENGQMLPFEPPGFSPTATLGGVIACGLSGPRRPYVGAARDFVLGVRMINGAGEILRFGGEVMKNVAGYDTSRLMVGAMGTLGLLLDISMKVLPRPMQEITLRQTCSADEAIRQMNAWAGQPRSLSAACHDGENCFIRLSGAEAAVDVAAERIGGEVIEDSPLFWRDIREQQHRFFDIANVWRVSVPPATPMLDLPGKWLIDWGGAQRWLISEVPTTQIRQAVENHQGHATLFRTESPQTERFHPLSPVVMQLHRNLKQAFDPQGLFNPGRMYAL